MSRLLGTRFPIGHRAARIPRVIAITLAAYMGVIQSALAQDSRALELAVKAAFLEKFQLYIEWPRSAFPSPSSPFVLCIIGAHPFGSLIDRAVSGQDYRGHPIIARQLEAADPANHCHVAYLASGDPQWLRAQLNRLNGQPVLTVTDGTREVSAEGVINFVVADDRVRFEVDTAAASRNGLIISSKLLSVAIAVRPRS